MCLDPRWDDPRWDLDLDVKRLRRGRAFHEGNGIVVIGPTIVLQEHEHGSLRCAVEIFEWWDVPARRFLIPADNF